MTFKNRPLTKFIFCFSLLIALLVVGWLLSRRASNDSHPSLVQVPIAIEVGKELDSTNRAIAQPAPDRVSQLKQMVETSNVPITFWGKVIDETGASLSGVRITYRIQKASLLGGNGIGPTKDAPTVLSTDSNGLFSIMNTRGVILDFEGFERNGYKLMGNQRSAFAYSRTPDIHAPDRNAPQFFVMKSDKKLDDVRSVSQKLRLPWDGKPIRIDLDSGEPSHSGNLTITAFRAASPGQVRGFEWRFSLEIQEGGLQQEAEREAALIAPEDGYHSSWSFGSRADEKPWKGGYSGNIYFKMSGKYGRLNIDVHPDARPDETALYLEGIINNGGGRNTEGRQ